MENTPISSENLHFESRLDLSLLQEKVKAIRSEIHKVIIGQEKTIDQIIVALLANGHILLEGVPGVAKTLSAKLLAQAIDMDFSRIQFTPDLMPSDILGTSIFNMQQSAFEFKKGPIFSNLVLIDEINRAPAKTQAASLMSSGVTKSLLLIAAKPLAAFRIAIEARGDAPKYNKEFVLVLATILAIYSIMFFSTIISLINF